jgi:two-component system NarL family sensor kinase
VTILQRSHQTSLDLLQTLVDIYRNDRDGLHLADSKVNLQQLTIEVVEMLQPIAQNRQIEIGLIYDLAKSSDSWMIRGDALQLKRVLINFISNAINHSLRGTEVTVELERTEQDTIVKVGDRGNGIDPVDLPHLFDRFYQGRKQRYGKGIGLGLYLSKQIITAHNGTIWAETRPTQGAILAFKLPNH